MQSVQEEKALAVQSLGAAKGELVAELGSLRAQNHKLTEDLAAVRPLHIYLYLYRERDTDTHTQNLASSQCRTLYQHRMRLVDSGIAVRPFQMG
jgi:hypothetical protein